MGDLKRGEEVYISAEVSGIVGSTVGYIIGQPFKAERGLYSVLVGGRRDFIYKDFLTTTGNKITEEEMSRVISLLNLIKKSQKEVEDLLNK